MTDLRTKSTAVQAATFPSHEFAAAVRDWVAAVTDAIEPAQPEPAAPHTCIWCEQFGTDPNCGAHKPAPPEPSEAERVDVGMQCLGCGDTERPCRCEGYSPEPATDRCWLGDSCSDCDKPVPDWESLDTGAKLAEHFAKVPSRDLSANPADWTPEPVEAECLLHEEIVRDGPSKWWCETHPAPSEAKVDFGYTPTGEPRKIVCRKCGKMTSELHEFNFYPMGCYFTCQVEPAQPEPAAPSAAESSGQNPARSGQIRPEPTTRETCVCPDCRQWSDEAQPVRMTPELERMVYFFENLGSESAKKDAAAVRQQAAQPVRLGKVRDMLNSALAQTTLQVRQDEFLAALAELDAHEGKGEGRG